GEGKEGGKPDGPGAQRGRHGEVHVLRAAHRAGPHPGRRRRTADPRRRDRDRLPAGLSRRGDRFRRHERPREPRRAAARRREELRPPRRAEHPPADHVPRGRAQPQPRDRRMSAGEAQDARGPAPIIGPGYTFGSVTDKISSVVLTQPTPRLWFVGFALAFSLMMLMLYALTWIVVRGVGLYGINIPVGWGFDIINFVWWIGIGHAGTLISAILLLLRQAWRQSINRFAEAMTLFAVACAAIFPVFHLGRPWLAYWLFPYPNTMGIWPNFRSPLIWDVFAVSTYAIVSAMFWYVGLIPDLATLRDRSPSRAGRAVYGMLAMG